MRFFNFCVLLILSNMLKCLGGQILWIQFLNLNSIYSSQETHYPVLSLSTFVYYCFIFSKYNKTKGFYPRWHHHKQPPLPLSYLPVRFDEFKNPNPIINWRRLQGNLQSNSFNQNFINYIVIQNPNLLHLHHQSS